MLRFLTGCMREWLTMSGTPDSSLDTLENKLRTLHLSEAQIRNSLTEPILKAILPGSVGIKLKICISKNVLTNPGLELLIFSTFFFWILLIIAPAQTLRFLSFSYYRKCPVSIIGCFSASGNSFKCGRPSPCHTGDCAYNQTENKHVCVCPSGLIGHKCQTGILHILALRWFKLKFVAFYLKPDLFLKFQHSVHCNFPLDVPISSLQT